MPVHPRFVVAGTTALVALVAGILLLGNGSDDSGSVAPTATGGGANPATTVPHAETGRSEQRSSKAEQHERQAGADTVAKVYGGITDAAQAGLVPLAVDVRTGVEAAATNPRLKEICALMSSRAQQETVDYAAATARLANFDWTCEKAVALMIRRTKQTRGIKRARRVEIIGVNVQGNRARATLDFGRGPATTILLVREGGHWKLGTSPGK